MSKVLIVDDSPVDRRLSKPLEKGRRGADRITVVTAENGRQVPGAHAREHPTPWSRTSRCLR